MNTEKIIKNLSKMNAAELKIICREMKCKVGSKKEMLARLVAPLLKGKYKFKMEKKLNDDTLIFMTEYLDFESLKNLISSQTDAYVKKLLISNIKFNNETIRKAVREYLKDQTKATQIYGDIGSWNVSNVTDMSGMFEDATAFNQPIGDWDVGNVTDMSGMFLGADAFNQPIGNWDVGNVTNMYVMFYQATSFNQPIGNWDVSRVTDMSEMFEDATSFNQPIGDWDTRNVTNMSDMFTGATSFNRANAPWASENAYLAPYSDTDDY